MTTHRRLAPRLAPGLCVVLALAVWLDPGLLRGNPDVQGAFLQFLIAAIVTGIEWLASNAVTVAVAVWHAVLAVGQALAWFGRAVRDLFVTAYDLTKSLYSRVLKPFLQWTWSEVQRFQGWLERHTSGLLRFLKTVRDHIRSFYTDWLRPVFDTIDTTRRVLQILADLHVPFAQAIEARLKALEDALFGYVTLVMGRLNQAMNVLNSVVTLDGLFQRVPLLASLQRDAGGWIGIFWREQTKGLDAGAAAAARAQGYPPIDADALGRSLGEYYTFGGGELAPAIGELAAAQATALQARQ